MHNGTLLMLKRKIPDRNTRKANIVLNPDKINFLANTIEKELTDAKIDLLKKYPIENYIELLRKYPDLTKFNYVGPEVLEFCKGIVEDTDERVLEKYHKLLLVSLIGRAESELNCRTLPDEIKKSCNLSFERILRQIENNIEMPGPYNYPEDFFSKDLSICTLKMIPLGSITFEFSSFPGNKLLSKAVMRKDIKQFIQIVRFIVFELKGKVVPFIELHLVTHDPIIHDDLNLEEMIINRRLVVQWMKMDESIKGSFCVSWMVDPQIITISPRHAYIHDFTQSLGFKYFYYEISEISVKHATLKSKTRRKLYNEGKYIPTNYLIAISRKRLLKWEDKMK